VGPGAGREIPAMVIRPPNFRQTLITHKQAAEPPLLTMSFGSGNATGTQLYIGSMSTNGVVTQMAACGTMTALLTGAPTLTYWRFRYLQYTNFAMLSIVQNFDTQVSFGQQAVVRLQKTGDLLYFLYLIFQLPGIKACPPRAGGCGPTQQFPYSTDLNNPCAQTDAAYFAAYDGGAAQWMFDEYGSCGDYDAGCLAGCGLGSGSCDGEPFAHWTNAIGQFLPKKVSLMIGTQVIDALYNDYLFMWEELAGKPGKRLTEMVGKYYCRDDLIAFSSQSRILYVPLPFYFTQTPGNALPLVAIAFSAAQLIVQFESLQNCVIVSGPDVQVVKCNGEGVLNNNDLVAAVESCQIFLDMLERDRFASTWFEQLITQTYPLYQSVCGSFLRIQLSFAYTVIELIWAVRRKCNEAKNNWFNYSGILGKEPIIAASLSFNSQDRQPMRNGSWYRLVQPYQYHTLIPDACVYDYSFALYPEDSQPSGGASFTRIQDIYLNLELQEGLQREDCTVIIFSRSFNLVKFRDGVAGLAQGG